MLILTLILLIFASGFPTVAAASGDRYLARFDPDLESVTVEACFEGDPPRYLYRHESAARYTEWIRAGDETLSSPSRRARLRVPQLAEGDCLKWRFNLAAAAAQGDYRMALAIDGAILTSGNLWFWRDNERRPITVKTELPAGMSISTPWKEVSGDGSPRFRVEQTPSSWSSRIAVGRFQMLRPAVGGTRLRLAMVGGFSEMQQGDVQQWVTESAEAVAAVDGRFPQDQPQILVVAIGPRSEAIPWAHVIRGGGVAAEFFVDETRPLSEFRADWTATHELSHLLLPYVSSRDRWLSEGLASYYQNVLRARDGRLSEAQAWRKLHEGFHRGMNAARGKSLPAASRSGWRSTMRIYWGGAAIWLMADLRLREISNGRQSVDSALSQFRDCCFTQGRAWRAVELFRELDDLTGHAVFMDLYEQQVTRDSFPELEPAYAELGLVPETGKVRMETDAPGAAIRRGIMTNPGQKNQPGLSPANTPRPPP